MKTKSVFISTVVVLVCTLICCKTIDKDLGDEKFMYYSFNRYGPSNEIVDTNAFVMKRYAFDKVDSVVVDLGEKGYLRYKEKYVRDSGLFRFCGGKLMLTHPIATQKVTSQSCARRNPFWNKEVKSEGFKIYKYNNINYKLYYYQEHNGVDAYGYDSYYLEDVGFICYYNFDIDHYILCDSTNVKNLDIKKITSQLIGDTSFFAKHIMKKKYPNFYRVKIRKNSSF